MTSYKFKINNTDYTVDINSIEGNIADVNVNGKPYKVEIDNSSEDTPVISKNTQNDETPAPSSPSVGQKGRAAQVTAPLPGIIIEVSVEVGTKVKAGEKVAVIEAMKMENEICATQNGTISAVHVSKGDFVSEGALIVTIE